MKRRVIGGAIVATLLALALALACGRIASILVAYKARQLCSGVFVAGRDPVAVERDLEVDDLAILGYIDVTVDAAARSAVAAFAAITREAVYRDSVGCALGCWLGMTWPRSPPAHVWRRRLAPDGSTRAARAWCSHAPCVRRLRAGPITKRFPAVRCSGCSA